MAFLYPFSGLEQVCGGSLPAIDKQTALSTTTRSSNLSINRLRNSNKALNSWACYRSWKCSAMKCAHLPQWFKCKGLTLQFFPQWHFHQHGHRHHRLSPLPHSSSSFQLFHLYELMLFFNTTDCAPVTLVHLFGLLSSMFKIRGHLWYCLLVAHSDAHHSVPSGAEARNAQNFPYICMAWCLTLWRRNFL